MRQEKFVQSFSEFTRNLNESKRNRFVKNRKLNENFYKRPPKKINPEQFDYWFTKNYYSIKNDHRVTLAVSVDRTNDPLTYKASLYISLKNNGEYNKIRTEEWGHDDRPMSEDAIAEGASFWMDDYWGRRL